MREKLFIDHSWDFREKLDKKIFIEDIFKIFDKREKFIIYNRYGFSDKDLSYREIGKILKRSQERIRQIELKCLRKLRYYLSSHDFAKAYYLPDLSLKRSIVNEETIILNQENEDINKLVTPLREHIKHRRLKNICKNFTFKEVNGWRSRPLTRRCQNVYRSSLKKKYNKFKFLNDSKINYLRKHCYYKEFQNIKDGITKITEKIHELYCQYGDFYFRFYFSINGLSFKQNINSLDTVYSLSCHIYSFLLTASALDSNVIFSLFSGHEEIHFKVF